MIEKKHNDRSFVLPMIGPSAMTKAIEQAMAYPKGAENTNSSPFYLSFWTLLREIFSNFSLELND